MTMLDAGVQGAKRQTLKNDPLLQLVIGVYRDRPKGMDPESSMMAKRFEEALDRHPDRREMLDTILEYFWVNAVRRISKKKPTAAERAARRKQQSDRIAQEKHEMTMKLDAKVQVMFLDMVMSNGKTLRDCTKAELQAICPRQDKVLAGIIKTLKRPKDTVGSVFKTNEQLERFWKTKKS